MIFMNEVKKMRELIYLNGEWDFMPIYDNDYSCELQKNIIYEKEQIG